MVKYKQIYLKSFGYTPSDFICCEISGRIGVDMHHIVGRGRGGTDRIENIMSLTRENHIKYGDKQKYMVMLLEVHREFLNNNGVKFDSKYFEEKIKQYESM